MIDTVESEFRPVIINVHLNRQSTCREFETELQQSA